MRSLLLRKAGPLSPRFSSEGTYPQYIKIMFEEGCGMENLRAFMVITALPGDGYSISCFILADVESNSDTIDFIQGTRLLCLPGIPWN